MTPVDASVGHSAHEDAFDAGRAAAEDALAGLETDPTLAYVFGSGAYDQPTLLEGIDDVLSCPSVGASTAGEVVNGRHHTESVAVLALAGDGIQAGTGSAPLFDEHPRKAGMQAAGAAATDLRSRVGDDPVSVSVTVEEGDRWRWYPKTLVNAFGPGLTGSKEWSLVGVQDALGWAHIAGGFAGDDWALADTYVYHDGAVLGDAMVVSILDVDVKTGIGVGHGLEPTEHVFTVTEAEGNRLYGLDGEAPLTIYRDLYGEKVEQEHFLMTRPLGHVTGSGEPKVLQPTRADPDDGSFIVGELPIQEGARLAILDASAESLLSGAEAAVEEALTAAGGPQDVAAALVFDCHTRWYHLANAETRQSELDVVRDRVGADVPIAGFYTYGEIATRNPLWEGHSTQSTLRQDAHQQSIVVQLITNEPLTADR